MAFTHVFHLHGVALDYAERNSHYQAKANLGTSFPFALHIVVGTFGGNFWFWFWF